MALHVAFVGDATGDTGRNAIFDDDTQYPLVSNANKADVQAFVWGIGTGAEQRVLPQGSVDFHPPLGNDPTYTVCDVEDRVYAVRPAPLAPVWLEPAAAAWAGTLSSGEPSMFELRFDTSAREPGTYRDTLIVEAGDSEAPSVAAVPLTLEVLPAVANEEEAARLEAFALGAAYPNPSRGVTVVSLKLTVAAEVTVSVYDVLGRRVAVLHDGGLTAGEHLLELGGSDFSTGLYMVRLTSGGAPLAQRVTIVQ